MLAEGIVTSLDAGLDLLALDPEGPAPGSGGAAGAGAGPPPPGGDAKGGEEKVAIKDHPQYSKYFKMLKVGLPVDAVKAKMQQEGVNPEYIKVGAVHFDSFQTSSAIADDSNDLLLVCIILSPCLLTALPPFSLFISLSLSPSLPPSLPACLLSPITPFNS
jgi:Subunit CCDC53 of WASH complex